LEPILFEETRPAEYSGERESMNPQEIRISRGGFLKLASLAAASASMAACGILPGPEKPDSSSPVQLVYQDWRTD